MDVFTVNNVNLDESTSSSDAADVLIRSTKAVLQQKSQTTRSENMDCGYRDINIYVRRLSDSVHGSCLAESGFQEMIFPPVLPVSTHSASTTAPEDQYHTASDPGHGVSRRSHLPREGRDSLKSSVAQTRDKEQEGQDVLISRYSAHRRGAVVAALKHRSHSVPVRREVRVQLLDAGRPQSSEPNLPEVQNNTAFSSQDAGAASTAAAITAAAIAATAPLIKAQSDMEARVAQVASELRRLQEAEGKVNNASENRSGSGADRTVQLQEQLNVLTQQRLQHLETIQGQQFELQTRLLGSALDAVTTRTIPPSHSTHHTGSGVTLPECVHRPEFSRLHVVENADAGNSGWTVAQEQSRETQNRGGKSLLEMPAPRNVIPKPTQWNRAAYSKQKRTHKPAQTKHGNGRLQEQISNNQKSTRHPAQPDGVRQVAIATVNDSQPEHSRENLGETCFFPTGRVEPERPAATLTKLLSTNMSQESLKGLPTLIHAAPSSSSSAVQQANAVLQDLSRIKDEMRNLIQTADAFPVKPAEPSHPAPPTLPSPPPKPPPPVSMPSEQHDKVSPEAILLSRPNQLQNSHPPVSMFEDAECVLRQVRQSRKVLEENLQAILRAKDGEVLHTQLEALSNNRDASEELRIKKTVDAWINTVSKEIRDELAQHGSVVQMKAVERDSVAAGGSTQQDQSSRSTAGKEAGRLGRERKGATAAARRKTSHRDSNRPQAVSTQASSQELASSFRNSTEQHPQASEVLKSTGDEAYLTKVYGKALYEGQRRTLKKGPYLRFNSPTPKSKVLRPKMVERVKGVKMKSCKTQTSDSEACNASLLQPVSSEPQYLFSPCSPIQEQQPGSLLKGYLMPMAIPLGKPRVDAQAALPLRVIISDKPATVITSIPPAPRVAPLIRKPNTLLLEVESESKKPAPNLQIQVQPSVNIESVSAQSCTLSPSPPPPLLPPPSFQSEAFEAQVFEDEAEENDGFPGTNVFEVADNSQEPELEGMFPDSPLELHGLPTPPVTLYHGPTFPPQRSQPSPLIQPVITAIQHRETLENRLVDWVEQQLMARMISGMFPQPVHTDPAINSEPEDSVSSDTTGETAGGLLLAVDAGVPVDSALIRQYVNEVLTDLIAQTLGQREGLTEPPAPASSEDAHVQQESAVLTPVPTPEPSVIESSPELREVPSPISTSDLSEHPSLVQSPRDSQYAQPEQPVLPELEPVETPVCTPVPSPRRTETPEPENPHNNQWDDVELPLLEEKLHSDGEEHQPQTVELSVAHEEEEESIIHPFSPVLPKPQNPSTAATEHTEPAPPECPSVKESSSNSSTSITETETETETDTAARHISEGELLFSCGQMAEVRALAEEGLTLQNLMTSFNSSLHGVQDMDYDPPSEGEVTRRRLVSAHRDPILSLLARMEQGPVSQSHQPERWRDDESNGELSEGQRPVLTVAQERVVMGHSLILQHQSIQSSAIQSQNTYTILSSPGQSETQHTGEKGAVPKNGGLSVNVSLSAEHTEPPHALHSFTASTLQPGDYAHQQAAEPRPIVNRLTPILVKQYNSTEEPGAEGAQQTGGDQRDSQSPTISTIEGDSDSFSDMF